MMLGITAQVKEAGIAWDKGEKKSKISHGLLMCHMVGTVFLNKECVFVSDLEVLRAFQNQIAAIQRDTVWWLHSVVPTISKVGPKDYVHWYVESDINPDSVSDRKVNIVSLILFFGQPPQGALHRAA